jgi:hypothetical protein
MLSLMTRCPLNDPKLRKQLQLAANFGHVGVTKAILNDYIKELKM